MSKKLVMDTGEDGNFLINGVWAYSCYPEEQESHDCEGSKKSGHLPMLFLADCYGTWFDEGGNVIRGYLFFKPDNEKEDVPSKIDSLKKELEILKNKIIALENNNNSKEMI